MSLIQSILVGSPNIHTSVGEFEESQVLLRVKYMQSSEPGIGTSRLFMFHGLLDSDFQDTCVPLP